jgi:hypothetical protein
VVEGARLESVFRGNSNEGSNPSLSAIQMPLSALSNQGFQRLSKGVRGSSLRSSNRLTSTHIRGCSEALCGGRLW